MLIMSKCRKWSKPVLKKLDVALTKAQPTGKHVSASEDKNSAGQIVFGGQGGS